MDIQPTAQDMTWSYRDLHNRNRLAKIKKQVKTASTFLWCTEIHISLLGTLWHLFTLVSQILMAVAARDALGEVIKAQNS